VSRFTFRDLFLFLHGYSIPIRAPALSFTDFARAQPSHTIAAALLQRLTWLSYVGCSKRRTRFANASHFGNFGLCETVAIFRF
jgi:hypothetical protein